ncbi:MAG: hypothetical protein ABI383_14635 [Acidobacteriaceae bacterium]
MKLPLPKIALCAALAFALLPASADVIVLNDGSSYSGHLTDQAKITFSGKNGVGYTFPARDVQSLAFTPAGDTITLRDGRTFSGHYTGAHEISFLGSEGVSYNFPVKDISTLVMTASAPDAAESEAAAKTEHAAHPASRVVPYGTEITLHTDENIDSRHAHDGQLFSATVADDVRDARGGVAIPRGTPASLVIRNSTTGGTVHTPELILDLYSVKIDGKQYRAISSNVVEHGREGLGGNRRTLEYTGGGTGLGALLGGIFGGGRGAGIGALAGAGGGALTQLFTRGKQVEVPAETTLTFRLERTLVLRP